MANKKSSNGVGFKLSDMNSVQFKAHQTRVVNRMAAHGANEERICQALAKMNTRRQEVAAEQKKAEVKAEE